MPQRSPLRLPEKLWTAHSLDLTLHRYDGQLLSQQQGFEVGKKQRKIHSRSDLAHLSTRPPEVDALTIYHWSNEGRVEQLKPVRAKRMSRSAFAYFRGMPALMLYDQAWENSNSGLFQQICGDCHLLNFGGFASPERNLLFGINDFDETLVAPFEWDLKRLCTSFILAEREVNLGDDVGLNAIAIMLNAYREHLQYFRGLSPLQTWYEKIDAATLLQHTKDQKTKKKRAKQLATAHRRTSASVLPKLTKYHVETGHRNFMDEPPLLRHPEAGEVFAKDSASFFKRYRQSLKSDRRVLFDRYVCTDVALKVVGVGSVGTRAAIALFEDADREPLILQMKEANPSILSPLFIHPVKHEGERVIEGQHLMQAANDIFLGFASYSKAHQQFYVRQLRDMKVSIDLDDLDDAYLYEYARSCGLALAHAHAKAGNADVLMGYLGKGEQIVSALQRYATAYAARNEQDYAQFLQEIAAGRIEVAGDEVL